MGVFADVRPGEAAAALVATLTIFLVLTSYYFVKVVREQLIMASGGAEVKSYASAGLAVISILVVKAYDWLYAKVPRMRLIALVFLFFAGCLVVFWALELFGVTVAIPFFFYAGMYGAFIIAIFWSFANDIYDEDQGKRLFPFVGIGATGGSVAGSALSFVLIEPLGTEVLMLIACGMLVACLGLVFLVNRMVRGPQSEDAPAEQTSASEEAEAGAEKSRGGFGLLVNDRYLLYLALLVLVLNWVNTTGEYILDRLVLEEAAGPAAQAVAAAQQSGVVDPAALESVEKDAIKDFVGVFRAGFFTFVNTAGMAIQALIVSRFIKYLGVRLAILMLPLVALGGYLTLAFVPILAIARVSKIAENSIDYSLQNTSQQALFLVTSTEAKYKAKAAIDTFVKRSGDVLSAGVVALGTALAFSTREFILVNVGLVVAWLGIVALLAREHRRRESSKEDTAQ